MSITFTNGRQFTTGGLIRRVGTLKRRPAFRFSTVTSLTGALERFGDQRQFHTLPRVGLVLHWDIRECDLWCLYSAIKLQKRHRRGGI